MQNALPVSLESHLISSFCDFRALSSRHFPVCSFFLYLNCKITTTNARQATSKMLFFPTREEKYLSDIGNVSNVEKLDDTSSSRPSCAAS